MSRAQKASGFVADPFDIDEIEAILEACENNQKRNMFRFAFGTGMRPSEYIALKWKSVNFDKSFVSVAETFVDGEEDEEGKTLLSMRDIDLRKFAFDALSDQSAYKTASENLVFLNPMENKQWTGDKQIRERWRRILKLANVRYRNPYQTRHTFASSLLMLDKNQLYVATQLGHANTSMITKHYGKWIKRGLDGDKRIRLEAIFSTTF